MVWQILYMETFYELCSLEKWEKMWKTAVYLSDKPLNEGSHSGFQKTKFVKEIVKLNWNFLRGEFKRKHLPWEQYGYFL